MTSSRYREGHLSNELLVRSLDGELAHSERNSVERHLQGCLPCRHRQAALCTISVGLEQAVRSVMPVSTSAERSRLITGMNAARVSESVPVGRTLARFGWVLAAAATVALSLAYLPFIKTERTRDGGETRVARAGSPFEVDGETFFYLPYSNPDLPASGSHVIQMRVPVSSLADAGVLVEPVESRITTPDRAVLADVLLGMDGQPIGVHVLSAD